MCKLKNNLFLIYGFLHSLKYPKILKETVKAFFSEKILSPKEHIILAANWLLFMQNNDGGYSRKFSFITGRDKSYTETTGYIIPTLLDTGEILQEKKYINSALKGGDFLLSVQNKNGSFNEIDHNLQFAFDTGQCLTGLNRLYEYTKESCFLEAAEKASYWLIENQEEDGSWKQVAFNGQKHTYYIKVAAAMYKYALLSEDNYIKNGALKHLEWVLDNQFQNGYFKFSSFLSNIPAYLHTLMYIAEGLLDFYEMTKENMVLDKILLYVNNFKNINLNRDLILGSQYNEEFKCVNKERCITGLAQWVGVALRLFKLTKDEDYINCAVKTIHYLKAKQLKHTVMKGGFSGSIPFWGKYGSFDFVNWNNKFFLDALILYDKLNFDINKEQETFVSSAFTIYSESVTDNITFMDKKYLEKLKSIFCKYSYLKIADVGCGKGSIINELKKIFPNFDFFGIDPVFENNNIKKGSVYNIPFADEEFDVVLCFEVLQHTYINNALKEIYRVLKKDAMVIIGERNPFSILGLLKPLFEFKGKWMYPPDSPFREKWYNKNQWEYFLKICGFELTNISSVEGKGKKFVNRYYFIEGKKI